ncbi:hypothetical protein CUJ84_Chr001157 [Rhizobium leguminosarum]|uniref:Uncharacterized protein n=1 Tax=Rhizobium leguminosarum TaxID=384 RepID=A0A2K9YZZ4_RHILE|nr:hypothetical protein CUJ84_Chr001157 [Rhizobium leguminosarum]
MPVTSLPVQSTGWPTAAPSSARYSASSARCLSLSVKLTPLRPTMPPCSAVMKAADAEGLLEKIPREAALFVVVQPDSATATRRAETIMPCERKVIASNHDQGSISADRSAASPCQH